MTQSQKVMMANSGFYLRAATACSLMAMAAAISTPAAAQEAPAAKPAPQVNDDSTLGDIIVTARKRSESIDTVPLAITAMTSDKIEARNLKSIEDVAAFSPGFYTQSQTGTGAGRNDRSFRQLTFRGVGASSTNIGASAAGVAFLDGAPVLNGSLSNVQDLERVEVLRGPQSAYFGRSTFIGAVNYITKDPTNTWTGRVTGEVAEGSLVDTSLAISGPIVPDVMTFRLAGRYYRKNGQYQTSNSNVRVGDQGTDSISLTVLTKPTSNLRIRTFFNHFEDSDGPPAQYYLGGKTIRPGGGNCNLGGTGGAYWCGDVPQKADPSLISANLNLTPQLYGDLVKNVRGFPIPFDFSDYLDNFGLKRKANQFSNRIDYTIGDSGFTITSVTAFHNEKIVTLNDLGFRANPTYQFSTTVGYKDHDFSQELRLVSPANKPIRFVVGGNYIKLQQSTSGIIGQFGVPGAPFTVFNFSGQPAVGYVQAETPSVFGGVYFDLVKALTLTVEGRYQQDKISGHFGKTATTFTDISQTYKSFSPRISLDYKFTPTSTIYALVSRGYKPGGFNNSIISQPQFVLDQLASTGAGKAYGQEKLDNYETGIKGSFFNGRLRLALDGYIGRYSNVQIPQPKTVYTTQINGVTDTSPGAPQNTLVPIISVGKVDLKGIEFEAEAIIVPGLKIGGTFAYTGTKIKSWFCSECSSILAQNPGYVAGVSPISSSIQATAPIGKRLPGAPEITFTLSSSYEHQFDNGLTAYIGGDYLYRGRYYADAANIASSGASKMFNARIGVRKGDYNLEIFARNLFDNQSPSIAYGVFDSALHPAGSAANTVLIGLPDRRRIGVRASVNF